ncbi:NitT/TauT family transport system ATP-binding protein [Paraburkholderia eburnea]|uniref:NitT/TauT family transport system ATP-binding protein n=1 Tax=Paraburkholderia eburnea TaxID=1189126 RepID=A0A2S4M7K2_9BURK|nr:ABC transporter ATP-binding protein [Paraburkholderia eburnea]POR50723.1 NitT/TauT family transport system ATP-binding protein [Paraburkholderia eburnea]PRZ21491.1 NitT/TauT family transport system ATP-binding protein [Paraburkholderia eburnea]
MNGFVDTSGGAPRLQLRGIGLRRQQRSVLANVDLDVAPGELVSIIGASGAGKSTLLRVAAGLIAPHAGAVRVDGAPLDGPRPDVALAFQDACLLPWLSVERNVAFGLGFRKQPKLSRRERDARVHAALHAVGLAHAAHFSPRELSGGMAQRAALARALARAPRTLLLDEPFGALDELTRGDMQRLLVRVVRESGAATLLVTHDIDEALLVSDRVAVLGPDGIALDLAVGLPEPRDAHVEALGALRVRLVSALHATMARAPHPA